MASAGSSSCSSGSSGSRGTLSGDSDSCRCSSDLSSEGMSCGSCGIDSSPGSSATVSRYPKRGVGVYPVAVLSCGEWRVYPPPGFAATGAPPLAVAAGCHVTAWRKTIAPVVRSRTRNVLCGWLGDMPSRMHLAPRDASLCSGVGLLMYPMVPKGWRPSNDGGRPCHSSYGEMP